MHPQRKDEGNACQIAPRERAGAAPGRRSRWVCAWPKEPAPEVPWPRPRVLALNLCACPRAAKSVRLPACCQGRAPALRGCCARLGRAAGRRSRRPWPSGLLGYACARSQGPPHRGMPCARRRARVGACPARRNRSCVAGMPRPRRGAAPALMRRAAGLCQSRAPTTSPGLEPPAMPAYAPGLAPPEPPRLRSCRRGCARALGARPHSPGRPLPCVQGAARSRPDRLATGAAAGSRRRACEPPGPRQPPPGEPPPCLRLWRPPPPGDVRVQTLTTY